MTIERHLNTLSESRIRVWIKIQERMEAAQKEAEKSKEKSDLFYALQLKPAA